MIQCTGWTRCPGLAGRPWSGVVWPVAPVVGARTSWCHQRRALSFCATGCAWRVVATSFLVTSTRRVTAKVRRVLFDGPGRSSRRSQAGCRRQADTTPGHRPESPGHVSHTRRSTMRGTRRSPRSSSVKASSSSSASRLHPYSTPSPRPGSGRSLLARSGWPRTWLTLSRARPTAGALAS